VSWLFPDDGCFARAEIAAQWLEERGYPKPAKIFIFGSLRAQTSHHPDGEVEWWYHVVVGYKTARGLMVFDPSVDPREPLTLKAWSDSMGDTNVTYSFCDRNSVDPDSTCVGGAPENPAKTAAYEQDFLDQEWDRQIELGRDPTRILGDEPPWIKTSVRHAELLVP
jgi:Glutaminase